MLTIPLTPSDIYVCNNLIWQNQRLWGRLPTGFTNFQMEVTKEMLDAIEAVKGKRNEALWDPRCAQYMQTKSKGVATPPKPTVKPVDKG